MPGRPNLVAGSATARLILAAIRDHASIEAPSSAHLVIVRISDSPPSSPELLTLPLSYFPQLVLNGHIPGSASTQVNREY